MPQLANDLLMCCVAAFVGSRVRVCSSSGTCQMRLVARPSPPTSSRSSRCQQAMSASNPQMQRCVWGCCTVSGLSVCSTHRLSFCVWLKSCIGSCQEIGAVRFSCQVSLVVAQAVRQHLSLHLCLHNAQHHTQSTHTRRASRSSMWGWVRALSRPRTAHTSHSGRWDQGRGTPSGYG